MSSRGHKLMAAAMAATGFALLSPGPAALFAGGCLAGACAPDWLEITWFRRGRNSLIPHRTLTHWPWPWFASLILLLLVPLRPSVVFWPLIGFTGSAILHLAADLCAPTGIPLKNPFGSRYSLNLIHTGSPGEIVVTCAAWVVPAMAMLSRVGR